MFQIKVCGVTSEADAAAVRDAGADALGLNFYAGSKRYVTPAAAAKIAAAAKGLVRVGVFVNSAASEILRIAGEVGLDLVQLHGDEPPELLAELKGLPVMRAFRVGPESLPPAAAYLQRCAKLNALPRLVLLDAFSSSLYGGTGNTLAWKSLRGASDFLLSLPVVLAGGLTPENVATAIAEAAPAAVDTASGVESAPALKDLDKVAAFVAAAKSAFAAAGALHKEAR